MDEEEETSQLSLLEKISPKQTRMFMRNSSLTSAGHLRQVNDEEDMIDQFVRGQEVYDASVPGGTNRAAKQVGCMQHINVGLVAVLFASLVAAAGFAMRYSHLASGGFNRYLIASGLYGLVAALANFLAVQVLLKTMFLSRNECILQSSVKDIVMNLMFSRDAIETELVSQARRAVTMKSIHRAVQRIVSGPAASQLIDARIQQLTASSEGMLLAMLGVTPEHLKRVVAPAVLRVVSEIAPIVESEMTMDSIVSTEQIYQMVARVVTVRAAALSVSDLQSIVSEVLLPQLSLIVLWGCVVGMCFGALSEAFKLSEFISTS